jgi:uncharacterized protein YchJ
VCISSGGQSARGQPSATIYKGSENLRALFLGRNPRATRGSGHLCCGWPTAKTPEIGHFLGPSRPYVLKHETWLRASWHPDTRPSALQLDAADAPAKWLGLEIKRHASQDANHATVEFVARCRYPGGRAGRLHEISRFVRENGQWLYLDAQP